MNVNQLGSQCSWDEDTMKCLIVDDQIENRLILAKIMEPYAQCDMAVDGADAVDLFQRKLNAGTPFDLILMDIMMPIMDGQEALLRIRNVEHQFGIHREQETSVIMVTAVDATSEMKKAFENGRCTDYVNKPINRGKLLVLLSEHGLIPKDWWKEK